MQCIAVEQIRKDSPGYGKAPHRSAVAWLRASLRRGVMHSVATA